MATEALIAEKDAKIKELSQEILTLKDQLAQLKRMIFGKKSERFVYADNQLNLFTGQVDQKQEAEKTVEVPSHKRKVKNKNHPGRSLLKNCDHLECEEVHIETPHTEEDIKIGELVRQKLAYTPGKFYIKKLITPKYKSAKTDQIIVGEQPSEPIPKCEADISLLTYIVVSKFVDHLPEYRLQQIFKRDGVNIPPSTMNGWTHKLADLFKPMDAYLGQKILSSGYIQMDESTIKVLKSKKGKAHLGYMWVIYSPALRSVRFMYHKGREKEAPQEMLIDFKGKLQCDGYNAYESVDIQRKDIDLSNCNVHARRKFEKALSNDKDTATKAMRLYQKMYKIERKINEKREDFDQLQDFYEYRYRERQVMQEYVDELKELVFNPPMEVLPKSSIGTAIMYTRRRWERLTKYMKDGELEMDTNFIENCIRPLALGRKNYLFAGNHTAAINIGVFYTIFNTCRHLGVNVTEYTKWYLSRINTIKINQIATLSPMAYKNSRENPNT